MEHPLDAVHEKLERAHENILNLEREIRVFLEGGQHPVIPDKDPKLIEKALKDHAIRKVPRRFSILSGEIIHQLRSCLDHIAWQLSDPLRRESNPTAIEFPIFLEKPADKPTIKGYERKVKGMPARGVEIIESLQPYHRAPAMLTGPRSHPLWIIHELDIIDKHRELILTSASFDVSAEGIAAIWLMLYRDADLPETEVASLGRSFDPNSEIATQISFLEFGGRKVQPVIPGLSYLANKTHDIAGLFADECF